MKIGNEARIYRNKDNRNKLDQLKFCLLSVTFCKNFVILIYSGSFQTKDLASK